MQPAVIFFDLGNVLFEVRHEVLYTGLERGSDLDGSTIRDFLRNSDLITRFRLGKIDAPSFFSSLKKELRFQGSEERLVSLWCAIILPIPENFACVYRLHPLHRLGIISNTNETHCSYLESNFEVLDCFETKIYSHQAGLEKPSLEIFEKSLLQMGVLPEESLFIDDKQENVAAAEQLGLSTIHLTDSRSLPIRLEEALPGWKA